MPQNNMGLVDLNSMRRIPDGAASLVYPDNTRVHIPAQYVEVGNHGLLFATRHLAVIRWAQNDQREQLFFRDFFQPLLRLTVFGGTFLFSPWVSRESDNQRFPSPRSGKSNALCGLRPLHWR